MPTEISKPRAAQLVDHYQVHKSGRANFETYWQSLHDYFYIEAQDINKTYTPGNELMADYLFDSTTLESADVLASGFMNYLTPPTSKWFAIRPKDPELKDNKRVLKWCDEASEQVNNTLNRSNFYTQMIENYKASGVYGTSVMLEEMDEKEDVRFYSLPVKNVVIVEDGRGRVSEYYLEFEFTAEQAASRWGKENLSTQMQEEVGGDNKRVNKHQFLLHIAERHNRDVRKSDKENMKIAAEWVDVEGKHIVENGGYEEFPAFCHRFSKRPFIPWGFSPAMKALPFARVLNAIAKTNLRAMMKNTDPPIAVPDNAFLMPFKMNPRKINYYRKDKMTGGDIFEFGNHGDVKTGMTAIEYYSQQVKSLMYNDVFLAFNNITKDMNNPEVYERINEKMTLLGPAVGRFIAEMLNPVVERTLGIEYRLGKLPTPPAEFVLNPEYEIECISQLAQAQRRSELNALVTGLTMVGQMAAVLPETLDKIDGDKAVDETWKILGSPTKILRDDKDVMALRSARQEMAQRQIALEQTQAGANIVKTGSEVDKNLAQTQNAKPQGATL